MKLREAARAARGVDLIEATVTELLPREGGKGIGGVRVARKGKDGEEDTTEALSAALVIVADGCFSNFRSAVMGGAAVKPETKSHFVGAILKDARLPIPNHGHRRSRERVRPCAAIPDLGARHTYARRRQGAAPRRP